MNRRFADERRRGRGVAGITTADQEGGEGQTATVEDLWAAGKGNGQAVAFGRTRDYLRT